MAQIMAWVSIVRGKPRGRQGTIGRERRWAFETRKGETLRYFS